MHYNLRLLLGLSLIGATQVFAQEAPSTPPQASAGQVAQADPNDQPAALTPEMEQELRKQMHEYLQKLLDQIDELFRKYDSAIMEQVFQLATAGQVKTLTNKETALKHIVDLRGFIDYMRKTALVPDPTNIRILIVILNTLADNGHVFISSNLAVIEMPDFETAINQFISRGDQQFDPEKVEAALAAVSKKIDTLSVDATNLGLSRMNRAYRRFETFWGDWHMTHKVAVGSLGAILGYYLLSNIEDKQLINTPLVGKLLVGIKNFAPFGATPFIGHIAIREPVIQTNANGKDVAEIVKIAPATGFLTKIQEILQDKTGLVNFKPVAYQFWSTLIATSIATNAYAIKDWTSKKLANTGRFLRGEEMIDYADGMIINARSDVRFTDIIGREELKKTFSEVIDYLVDPTRYSRIGIKLPNYLLCGKTRAGKSFFIEAVRNEAQARLDQMGSKKNIWLCTTDASKLKTYPGGLARVIQEVKRDGIPTILVIDEIDMMDWQRDKDSNGLCNALVALSGINDMKNNDTPIVIVGCTNLPENLDAALLQQGRFGKQIWFDYPQENERFVFLVKELTKRGAINISKEYAEKLARETDARSFEDLRTIIDSAMQKAKSRMEPLSETHLETALDEELRKIAHDVGTVLNKEQTTIVASHLAAQALISTLLNPENEIAKVTIKPHTKEIKEQTVFSRMKDKSDIVEAIKNREIHEFGALFMTQKQNSYTIITNKQADALIKVLLAGGKGEELVTGSNSLSYRKQERNEAFEAIKNQVTRGLDIDKLSKQKQDALNDQAFERMSQYEQEVGELLNLHRAALEALTHALQEKMSLTGKEVTEIIQSTPKAGTKEPYTFPEFDVATA